MNAEQNKWTEAMKKAPGLGTTREIRYKGKELTGIAASRVSAEMDYQRVKTLESVFSKVAGFYALPPALLAAIASRESACGATLEKSGWGDGNHAFGIMQVDKRYHEIQGKEPSDFDHIFQATGILLDYMHQVKLKFPNWEDEYILKGGLVAYNSGLSNVQTKEKMDVGTTGNDYSSDVLARAMYYYDCWLRQESVPKTPKSSIVEEPHETDEEKSINQLLQQVQNCADAFTELEKSLVTFKETISRMKQ